eukprot:SAG11_NODE_3306_length_2535_cov_4.818966_2_plen_235_part_00
MSSRLLSSCPLLREPASAFILLAPTRLRSCASLLLVGLRASFRSFARSAPLSVASGAGSADVHSKGKDGDNLVFGLYTCGGKETCVGGRVGSEDHWEQDAATYAEWGVDWCACRARHAALAPPIRTRSFAVSRVKMDWCNSKPQDPKTTYPKMGKALNESGRHIHFVRPRAPMPGFTWFHLVSPGFTTPTSRYGRLLYVWRSPARRSLTPPPRPPAQNMCEWGLENPWEWGCDC